MYMRPFTTSRMITVRLPPPVLPGGISGSTSPHSSSVRSLGYRNLLRSYRARFLLVHIGDPSSNQATTLESQMIHMIQELPCYGLGVGVARRAWIDRGTVGGGLVSQGREGLNALRPLRHREAGASSFMPMSFKGAAK